VERDGVEAADKVLPSWSLDWLHEDAVREDLQGSADAPVFAEQPKPQEAKMPDVDQPDSALQERIKALEAREAAFAEKERRAEAKDVIKSIVEAGKLTTPQADGLVEFMASLHAEASVAFGEGEAKKMIAPAAFFRDFLNRLPVQVEFREVSRPDSDAKDSASPEEVARRAILFQENMRRAGVELSTTDAVAAVRRGEDKEKING